MRYRLSITLPPAACLTFYRNSRDFSQLERATLDVLRAPLTRAARRSTGQTAGLTEREATVLQLVALGRTNVAIAHLLGTSPRTVAKHLEHIYRKLGVSGRAAAVGQCRPDYASANGIYPRGAGIVP
jgi:DNA-binding CsgD family transcriptional regulator